MSRSHVKRRHLDGPASEACDHYLEIVPVDNCHQWEMRCVTCGRKHVKWAKQEDYLWYLMRLEENKSSRFRQLFWAPMYDNTYELIQQLVEELKSAEYNQAAELEKARQLEYQSQFEQHYD